MSDYFGDRPSNDESIFAGTGDDYRRSRQDLFGGDFYADDEQVTRGVSFAQRARCPYAATPYDAVGKDGFFGKQEFVPPVSQRLVFPGCQGVDLEVRDVPAAGKSYYVSAPTGTELAEALLAYFAQQDGVAMPREQKRAVKAHLCAKYELLKIKVSLCIPAEAPQFVAMTWERKAGDSVEFMAAARGCAAYLGERGLRCEEPADQNAAFASFGLPPPLMMEASQWGLRPPPPLALGEKTPNFLTELPALNVEPCTVEDLQPLLSMAAEPHPASKAEACVDLCRILDGETDAPAVHQALTANPQVLLGLLQEPACVLAAPALAEKLVPACPGLDWAAVAGILAARLPSEAALGQRLLARCLCVLLHSYTVQGLDLAALAEQCADGVAKQRLAEARFALRAQAA